MNRLALQFSRRLGLSSTPLRGQQLATRAALPLSFRCSQPRLYTPTHTTLIAARRCAASLSNKTARRSGTSVSRAAKSGSGARLQKKKKLPMKQQNKKPRVGSSVAAAATVTRKTSKTKKPVDKTKKKKKKKLTPHQVQAIKYNKRVEAIAQLWREQKQR